MTQLNWNGPLVGRCVQLVTKACRQVLEKARMSGTTKTLALYMCYNEAKHRFFVLSKRWNGLSSLKQLNTVRSFVLPLTDCKVVDEPVYSLSDPMDAATRFSTYYMFEKRKFLY